MSATKSVTTVTSMIGTNNSDLNGIVQLKQVGLVTLSKQNSIRIAFQIDFITRRTFEKKAASLKQGCALGPGVFLRERDPFSSVTDAYEDDDNPNYTCTPSSSPPHHSSSPRTTSLSPVCLYLIY